MPTVAEVLAPRRRASLVETDTQRVQDIRSRASRLPSMVVKLAEVLQSGSSSQRPFKYMPQAWNARDDELLREKKYTILDQMRRHPVIADAMRAKRAVLIQGWRVPPCDEKDPIAVAVARFCSAALDEMRGGFIGSLYRVTNAYDYGFSLHERQLKMFTRGPWLGMYRPEWLYRLPHFLDFERDKATGRPVVLQRQPGGAAPKKIFADRCLHYVYQDDLDPFQGMGDLRGVYDYWWMADTTEKLGQLEIEGKATGRVKVGVDLENNFRDLTDEMMDEATKLIDNWQQAFAFIEFPGLKVDVLEGTEGAGGYFLQVIQHCHDLIRAGIGKPDLLATKSGSDPGSLARAKQQSDLHYAQLGKPQNDLEELIPEQEFWPLLEANGIPLDYCPGFSLSPPEADQGMERAKQFDAGIAAGSLKMRDGDEDEYRQWIGARPTSELGEPVAAAAAPDPAGSGLGPAASALAHMIYGAALPSSGAGRRSFVAPDTAVLQGEWVEEPAEARTFAQAEAYEEDPALWVRLRIPSAVAEQIAQSGGEPAEDLHLTLCYVGRQSELPTVDAVELQAALSNALSDAAPLRARLSGAGRFLPSSTSDAQSVIYASVDAPGLGALRSRICQALASVGLPPKLDHDFTPHVTLLYTEDEADLPDLPPLEFLADRVLLGVFGQDVELRLVGPQALTFAEGGQFAPGGGRQPGTGGSDSGGSEPRRSVSPKTREKVKAAVEQHKARVAELDGKAAAADSEANGLREKADALDSDRSDATRDSYLKPAELAERDTLVKEADDHLEAGRDRANERALDKVDKLHDRAASRQGREVDRLQGKADRAEERASELRSRRENAKDELKSAVQQLVDEDPGEEGSASNHGAQATRRTFASADPLIGRLDALAREHHQAAQFRFARALWDFWGKIERTFLSDQLDPKDKLDALRSLDSQLSTDAVARSLIEASEVALQLGKDAAGKDVTARRTFDAHSVNPLGGSGDLSQWSGLMKARSYRVADELRAEVVGRIRRQLEKAFLSGETNRMTQTRLETEFSDMAGARLIEPGPSPGSTFRSPLVQETTVRTAMAEAADKGKAAVWQENEAVVPGFERYEDIDPARNHPLSPKVNGLLIPWSHPLAQEFVGALHYNERGGIRPVTARRAETPGFAWSTDAEIRRAYDAKRRLSPDFV